MLSLRAVRTPAGGVQRVTGSGSCSRHQSTSRGGRLEVLSRARTTCDRVGPAWKRGSISRVRFKSAKCGIEMAVLHRKHGSAVEGLGMAGVVAENLVERRRRGVWQSFCHGEAVGPEGAGVLRG